MILGLAGKKQGGKSSICQFLQRNENEFVLKTKIFPMAGPLKQLCIDVLGLAPEQVYGTEEQKNSLTRYKWENLPHYNCLIEYNDKLEDVTPTGFMTARQVMQQVGTEIFRRMYGDIWAEANIRKIVSSGYDGRGFLAIVDDVRFPNEVKFIKDAGGIVVKLTRNVAGGDEHASERELDQDKYDWNNFDYIVDNQYLSLTEQNKAIVKILREKGMIE